MHALAIGDVLRSVDNPRQLHAPEAADELRDSIRREGVLQPILVRRRGPFRVGERRARSGSIGWEVLDAAGGVLWGRDDVDASEALAASFVLAREHYEIVFGERRWRAARAAGLKTVPAFVRTLSDEEAWDLRWSENLKRDGLDPVDEARSFRAMLDRRDERGKALHTVESLAKRIGKTDDYVKNRLPLVYAPSDLVAAIRRKEKPVGWRAVALVGTVPSEERRQWLAREILQPQFQDEPLTVDQVRVKIREECARELRTAPFDTRKGYGGANIVAAKCGECPCNSVNMPEAENSRVHRCMNLECFRLKERAHWEAISAAAALEGKRVLSIEESRGVFPDGRAVGTMAPTSTWVTINERPSGELLKPEVENPPMWGELIGDQEVPVAVARDQGGHLVELLDRGECIAAAVRADEVHGTNETAVFRDTAHRVKRGEASQKRDVDGNITVRESERHSGEDAEDPEDGGVGVASVEEIDRRLREGAEAEMAAPAAAVEAEPGDEFQLVCRGYRERMPADETTVWLLTTDAAGLAFRRGGRWLWDDTEEPVETEAEGWVDIYAAETVPCGVVREKEVA